MCLAWALTVWKSQGMTIKGLVKFVLRENEIEHSLTHVGLSRALARKQIDTSPGCSVEKLTTKISIGSTLKVRLIENKRLDVSSDNCEVFYFDK